VFLTLYDLGLGINFSPLLRRECSARVKQYFDKFKTWMLVFKALFGCELRAEMDRTRKRALVDFRSLLKRQPILLVKWIERI
jgi:hypothetical protein